MIKPSEHCPVTSALFAELIPKYLNTELYHVVQGGIPKVTKVCERFPWPHMGFSDAVSHPGARILLGSQCVYNIHVILMMLY